MSISAVNVALTRPASSSACASASRARFGVAGDQRRFGDVAKARERRAEIVGDVVERGAHARDQFFDPFQHLVDAGAELVERIARVPRDRHARAELSGLQNRSNGGLEGAKRREAGARQQEPSRHRGDRDQSQHLETAGAKAVQQLVANVGAASDLDVHPVGERDRADLQHGAARQSVDRGKAGPGQRGRVEQRQVERGPPGRRGEVDDLGPIVHDADQESFVASLPGVGLYQLLQPGQPRALVFHRVPRQHRLEHPVVLRGQSPREQHVGGDRQRDGADDEEDGVPEAQPKGERRPERPTRA